LVHPLFATFQQELQALLPAGHSVLLAISGGVDSVVLAHLLKTAKVPVTLAHVNFQLRGEESIRDEQFVRQLAQDWGMPLEVIRVDTHAYAVEHKCSVQVAARQIRYNWFDELLAARQQAGERCSLATAHHADDSVETFLINLLRGTGLDGLQGIAAKRNRIIRPLLFATRQMIEAYATAQQLSWVEDSSNSRNDYARNFIRNEWLPAANAYFPQVAQNIAHTIGHLQEAKQLYQQALQQHKKKLLHKQGSEWHIPILALLKTKPLRSIVHELIQPFGFGEAQIDEVLKLCNANSGSYLQGEQWRIIRHRKWLIVAPLQAADPIHYLLDEPAGILETPYGKLTWQTKAWQQENVPQLPANEVLLDASIATFPMMFRPWTAGDYCYPLGMAKKKKVARILIDQKLSKTAKEKVFVLESKQRIAWVAGVRMDDRFKITARTKEVIWLQLD